MKTNERNILIVDDEKEVRDLLHDVLTEEGYLVEEAENGYKAVEKVKENHFDIIFLDIKMSGMNGVEAYKIIREIDPRVTVVIVTAHSSLVEQLIKGAVKKGIYEVIYKPFKIDKIIETVERIINPVRDKASNRVNKEGD